MTGVRVRTREGRRSNRNPNGNNHVFCVVINILRVQKGLRIEVSSNSTSASFSADAQRAMSEEKRAAYRAFKEGLRVLFLDVQPQLEKEGLREYATLLQKEAPIRRTPLGSITFDGCGDGRGCRFTVRAKDWNGSSTRLKRRLNSFSTVLTNSLQAEVTRLYRPFLEA